MLNMYFRFYATQEYLDAEVMEPFHKNHRLLASRFSKEALPIAPHMCDVIKRLKAPENLTELELSKDYAMFLDGLYKGLKRQRSKL